MKQTQITWLWLQKSVPEATADTGDTAAVTDHDHLMVNVTENQPENSTVYVCVSVWRHSA